MEIMYPPLVEDSVKFYFQNTQVDLSDKITMYHQMVQRGIIQENGMPTDNVLKLGWVKDFYEESNLSFDAFLQIYPIFKQYEKEQFQLIDGFWEISYSFKEELLKVLESGSLTYDEALQLTEYLSER